MVRPHGRVGSTPWAGGFGAKKLCVVVTGLGPTLTPLDWRVYRTGFPDFFKKRLPRLSVVFVFF